MLFLRLYPNNDDIILEDVHEASIPWFKMLNAVRNFQRGRQISFLFTVYPALESRFYDTENLYLSSSFLVLPLNATTPRDSYTWTRNELATLFPPSES